ncbi:heparinase, partial [Pseudomonas aeruginosa]
MHLALAAILLQQVTAPPAALLDLLRIHLRRIVPTIRYAIAQDNNHGTSEAAALFIGGSWLRAHGEPDAVTWMRLGRKWLENRAKHLIGEDGSFS